MRSRTSTPRWRRIARTLFWGAGTASLFSCASLAGLDQYEIGACKGGEPCLSDDEDRIDGGGGGGGGDYDAPYTGDQTGPGFDCPSGLPGPSMVLVGTAQNPFCIDGTEVTVADYNTFLSSSPPTTGQPSECTWNTTFTPDGTADPDDLPQANVDWCDAHAYCAWAGKRLCGKIVDGTDPGMPLQTADLESSTADQWYIACSAGGQNAYPYGASLKAGACNLTPSGAGARRAAGTYPDCVGGSPGISDMLGNVWEWIDYCFTPADGGNLPENMICYSRGGGFLSTEDNAKCGYSATLAKRSGKNSEIGIRCCSR